MTTVLKAKWQKMKNRGEVPSPRHGYRAVALNDDFLIIHGGGDGRFVYRDLFILQPSTGEWRKISIPSLPERAGFGLAMINNNMYMFGGMSYNRRCLNDLYYLSLSTWKWDLMLPDLAPGTPPPCARVGHSFTRINDQLILMFAGVTEPAGHMMYLNDLYSLILESDDSCTWRLINAQCLSQPPARESHSACLYKPDSGKEKLIIYGGMNGHRLDDVWSFDISTYTWNQYCVPWGSNTPPARSMHAATISGPRMFVFGGWAPSDKHTNNDDFISPQNLCCFNLVDKKWEKLDEKTLNNSFPHPRTGHNMVVVQDKIYMWSGRTGFHYHDDVTVLNDLWSLQVTPQKVMNRLILSNKTETMIKVEWDPVPLATYYILQIQVMPMTPISNPELPSCLFSSSLNQISRSATTVPTSKPKPFMESSKTSICQNSTAPVSIPITNNHPESITVPSKINTYQCLSPKFNTKTANQPPTNNTPVLSSALPNKQISAPRVSISTLNNSKSSTVALNFGKSKNSIPIVTTRVCFSTEKSSSLSRKRNSPFTTTPKENSSRIPVLCHTTPDTPICVINTPDVTSVTKHVIHTPGITALDIHTPVTPSITTSVIQTPGMSAAAGISTPVIYTSVATPPITPHRSTLETFLKPKPILSRPSSVKLMRSSSGRPVAVVPKSLIPNRTMACGTKPSNIVIVARKRPYL